MNDPLNISGFNVLTVLNSFGTSITNLNSSVIQNQNQTNSHETGLSTLYNFRSNNENTLVTLENDSTIIHGRTPASEIQFNIVGTAIDGFTKQIKVPNIMLPNMGDYGNTNGTNTLTQQLAIYYAAPALPIAIKFFWCCCN